MGCSNSIKDNDSLDKTIFDAKTARRMISNEQLKENDSIESPNIAENKKSQDINKLKVKNKKSSSKNKIKNPPKGMISKSQKMINNKKKGENDSQEEENEEFDGDYDEEDKSSEGISDLKLSRTNRKSSRRTSKLKNNNKIPEAFEISKNSSELSSHSEDGGK